MRLVGFVSMLAAEGTVLVAVGQLPSTELQGQHSNPSFLFVW